jgi:hypothetical protein
MNWPSFIYGAAAGSTLVVVIFVSALIALKGRK